MPRALPQLPCRTKRMVVTRSGTKCYLQIREKAKDLIAGLDVNTIYNYT
jgi:hypothetical protein